MGRTACEQSPTKERLLDRAERLMLAQGYAATTVEDICEAAKLTKGSFFHYFQTKEALGKALLQRFCSASQRTMQAACCQERDPLKRVLGLLEFMGTMAKECRGPQGCLLGTFAQELAETHPKMRAVCAEAFALWAKRLQDDLDAAKARYAPRAKVDTASLAEYVIAVVEGAQILAKTQQDATVVGKSLGHVRRYLEMVFV